MCLENLNIKGHKSKYTIDFAYDKSQYQITYFTIIIIIRLYQQYCVRLINLHEF